MIKCFIISLFIFMINYALAEDKKTTFLPLDFLDLAKFVTIPTGEARNLAVSDGLTFASDKCKDPPTLSLRENILHILKPKNEGWRFSVTTSLMGPQLANKKDYVQGASSSLKAEVDSFISSDYSYSDRLKAAGNLCKNKSETERLQLSSYIGAKLNEIFDYDRAVPNSAASRAKVSPEEEWTALNQRAKGNTNAVSGVCRDFAYTLTQFMKACGFNGDQLSIQSFAIMGGAHEFVSVRGRDGKLYSINWSEFFKVNEVGGVAPAPNVNKTATGIDYVSYNADGKVVEKRRTELGEILKAVSGGTPSDPNYFPQLLRLEAQYGVLSASAFKAETQRGDVAEGMSAYVKFHNEQNSVYLSLGTAYANNSRESIIAEDRTSNLDQSIYFFQSELGAAPLVTLFANGDTKISVKPSAVISVDYYETDSKLLGSKNEQASFNYEGKTGLDLSVGHGRATGLVGVEANTGLLSSYSGNTEINGSGPGLFVNYYSARAGLQWSGERFMTQAIGTAKYSTYENQYTVSTSLIDKKKDASVSVVYTVYDRNYGFKDEYILVQSRKSFSLEKSHRVSIGAGARVPISGKGEEPTYMGTVEFR